MKTALTWTSFVPGWFKFAAPAITAGVAVIAFVLGLGEGRGASAEVMRAQSELLQRHTAEIAELRGSNSRLEGKVDALLGYFRITPPKE